MAKPELSPAAWHIPDCIHPLIHDGGIVYLNSKAGEWGAMNRRTGITLLKACGLLERFDLEWRELRQPTPVALSSLDELLAAGLLEPGNEPSPPFTQAVPPEGIETLEAGNVIMAMSELAPPSHEIEDFARRGLERALMLMKESFPRRMDRLREAREAAAAPATVQQASEIAYAVQYASENHPGRIACLERTTAAVLVGALMGLYIEMQLGAGVAPLGFHAWPRAEGQPVRLPYDEPIVGRYYPVFTV